MIRIELDKPDAVFAPGDLLHGSVTWESNKPIKGVELKMQWSSAGKSTDDSEVVVEQRWETEDMSGSIRFAWKAPEGPLSYDGTFFRLNWTISAKLGAGMFADKATRETSISVVVSPIGRPISNVEFEKSIAK